MLAMGPPRGDSESDQVLVGRPVAGGPGRWSRQISIGPLVSWCGTAVLWLLTKNSPPGIAGPVIASQFLGAVA